MVIANCSVSSMARGLYSLHRHADQCLSQDLETGCLKLSVVEFLSVQIFTVDHNTCILIFQS